MGFATVGCEAPSAPPGAAPDAPPPRVASATGRPDILLFTIDTARADHFTSYGHDRDTTPTVAALARRGTRFARAYAAASWTAPSVASVVSGVLPSEHGVRREVLTPTAGLQQIVLSDQLPSLIEAIHQAGYETVGVTANGHLARELGFARGFDDYICLGFSDIASVRDALSSRLERLRSLERPFFLWVHVLEPHAPYVEQPGAMEAFWPPDRRRYPEALASEFVRTNTHEYSPEELREALEFVKAAYDSELRAADDFLAELLRELSSRELAVIVTSDHGEEFFDHGGFGHGRTVFDESIRVPLVVALPRPSAPGRVVRTPVSLMDILPTVVSLIGGTNPDAIIGRSLLPALSGERLARRPVFSEVDRYTSVAAMIGGSHKYVEHVRGASAPALYHLASDPRETYNLVEVKPEIASRMRGTLRQALSSASARQPLLSTGRVSPTVLRQLRALGYIE